MARQRRTPTSSAPNVNVIATIPHIDPRLESREKLISLNPELEERFQEGMAQVAKVSPEAYRTLKQEFQAEANLGEVSKQESTEKG